MQKVVPVDLVVGAPSRKLKELRATPCQVILRWFVVAFLFGTLSAAVATQLSLGSVSYGVTIDTSQVVELGMTGISLATALFTEPIHLDAHASSDTNATIQDAALMAQLSALTYNALPLAFEYTKTPLVAGSQLHLNIRQQCVLFHVVGCNGDIKSNMSSAPDRVRASFLRSVGLDGPYFCALRSTSFGTVIAFRGSYSPDDAIRDSAGHKYMRDTDTMDSHIYEVNPDLYPPPPPSPSPLPPSASPPPPNPSPPPPSPESPSSSSGRRSLHLDELTNSYNHTSEPAVHGALLDAYTHAIEEVHAILANPAYAGSPIYLTGHGMGGGLATLAAYYIVGEMQAMSIPNRPVRVYTQGKPLIGNSDFAAAIEMLLQDPTSNLEVVKRHVLANELEAADRGTQKADAEALGWVHEAEGVAVPCGAATDLNLVTSATRLCKGPTTYARELLRVADSVAGENVGVDPACLQRLPLGYHSLNLCGASLALPTTKGIINDDGTCAPLADAAWLLQTFEVPDLSEFERFILAFIIVTFSWLCLHVVGVMIKGCLLGKKDFWRGPYLTGLGGTDGSTNTTAPEKLLKKYLGCYCVDQSQYFVDTIAMGAGTEPIRIPPHLAKQGFRGRSDDATKRFPNSMLARSLMTVDVDGDGSVSQEERAMSIKKLQVGSTRDGVSLKGMSVEQQRAVRQLQSVLKTEGAPLATALVSLNSGGANELSQLMDKAGRKYAIISRLRGLLRRALIQKRNEIVEPPKGPLSKLKLSIGFQACDHSRENFLSTTVSSGILMIGAAQVMCILGVSNAQAWTLMFNDVVPDAPKLVPPNVAQGGRNILVYLIMAAIDCLLGVGNVKPLDEGNKDEAALLLSTAAHIGFLSWTFYSFGRTGWSTIGEEVANESLIIAIITLLLWITMLVQIVMCVQLIVMVATRMLGYGKGKHSKRVDGLGKRMRKALLKWMKVENAQAVEDFPTVLTAAMLVSISITISIIAVVFLNIVPRLRSESARRLEEFSDLLHELEAPDAVPIGSRFIDSSQTEVASFGEPGSNQNVLGWMLDLLDLVVKNIQEGTDWLVAALSTSAAIIFLLIVYGCRHTWETYAMVYDVLWHHGPAVLRFPIQRANAPRFFSTFVAFQLGGILLTMLVISVVFIFIFVLKVNWLGASGLRGLVLAAHSATLVELLLIRPILTPLLLHFRCGPAIFMVELWYLSISPLKGIARLGILVGISLLSFYTPAACIFPDGKEKMDTAHTCFVAYTMSRVEHDKQLALARDALRRTTMDAMRKQKGGDHSRITSPREA